MQVALPSQDEHPTSELLQGIQVKFEFTKYPFTQLWQVVGEVQAKQLLLLHKVQVVPFI